MPFGFEEWVGIGLESTKSTIWEMTLTLKMSCNDKGR